MTTSKLKKLCQKFSCQVVNNGLFGSTDFSCGNTACMFVFFEGIFDLLYLLYKRLRFLIIFLFNMLARGGWSNGRIVFAFIWNVMFN